MKMLYADDVRNSDWSKIKLQPSTAHNKSTHCAQQAKVFEDFFAQVPQILPACGSLN